ncbi:hypothetical protein SLS58_009753 [Diplodia intermedia]|uniref:Uncharacterized protein n=1 Tax=Diplodia intermedia TaxID=856260 RepID=A0ABR3TAN8_9PEZI
MRLEAAWREVRRRERQLEAREDALKLGQKRLRQDREALEKEKQRFQEKLEAQQEQQKTRTTTVNAAAAAHDEDNLRKRRAARRGRSRSKPRSKVVLPDDSWRRDHHKHQQQQDHRHSSWSSVNSSDAGTNASRHSSTSYPSDADSSEPKPRPEFKPAPAPPRTWSPTDLVPSLTAYNTRWTSLSPRSAHIPYPSPNHTAAELVDATHLRSLLHLLLPLPHAAMEERRRILAAIVAGSSSGSHHDAVVQYNVAHFFLVARGVACRPVLSGGFGAAGAAVLKPDYGFGLRRVPVDGKDGVTLRALVKEVRGELRRWHEDGLKYRGGDDDDDGDGHRHAERKINEGLVKDETAKAVFRAFTELRDELLAEVRWRKDIATAAGDGVAADTRREERPRSGYGNGPEEDQNGGGVDWSVLSEAML